jgi:anti-anti-sigma regulatory factor
MNKPSGNLMVAVCDQKVFVKIIGRADFTSSLDLKRLIGELWERNFYHFIFDLTECLTMDSTFLGVLSGVGLKLSNGKSVKAGSTLELINPNARIAETLENLGVVELFTIRSSTGPLADCFEPMPQAPDKSPLEITRNCLEAHETLMAIQPENVQKFKDVTQFLSDDLKRLEAGTKK